jgi:hypothetical protein
MKRSMVLWIFSAVLAIGGHATAQVQVQQVSPHPEVLARMAAPPVAPPPALTAVQARPSLGTFVRCAGHFVRRAHLVTRAIAPTVRPTQHPSYPHIAIIEDDGAMVREGDINLAAVSRIYYNGFPDDRDFIFVFASTKNEVSRDYNAYYRAVRQPVRGIGMSLYDDSQAYGSRGKLLGIANMNTIHKWTSFLYPVLDLWPLGVIMHEIGHQWIAYATTDKANIIVDSGPNHGHWDPLTHSEASIMYGNKWKQITPEFTIFGKHVPATFLSYGLPDGFSSLDKYLMGVHGPEKVKPFFYIQASSKKIWKNFAMPGNWAAGKQVNLTVQDIIAKYGPRDPPAANAQTRFKAAFILVAEAHRAPQTSELKRVEYFRKRIPEEFRKMTDGRFQIDATLPAPLR